MGILLFMNIINNISSENIFDATFAQDKEKRHLFVTLLVSLCDKLLSSGYQKKKSVYTNSY